MTKKVIYQFKGKAKDLAAELHRLAYQEARIMLKCAYLATEPKKDGDK